MAAKVIDNREISPIGKPLLLLPGWFQACFLGRERIRDAGSLINSGFKGSPCPQQEIKSFVYFLSLQHFMDLKSHWEQKSVLHLMSKGRRRNNLVGKKGEREKALEFCFQSEDRERADIKIPLSLSCPTILRFSTLRVHWIAFQDGDDKNAISWHHGEEKMQYLLLSAALSFLSLSPPRGKCDLFFRRKSTPMGNRRQDSSPNAMTKADH